MEVGQNLTAGAGCGNAHVKAGNGPEFRPLDAGPHGAGQGVGFFAALSTDQQHYHNAGR